MKAKRIVSILLTGSMLLSLLPVSALAAALVFDAPAQTTAKKGCTPLYRRPTPPAAPRRKPSPAAAVIWTQKTAPPIVLPSS